MAEKVTYLVGQGKLMAAERDEATGLPIKGFTWLGNVPALAIALNTDAITHSESYTGNRLQDLVLDGAKTANATITMEQFDRDAMELALYGKSSVTTAPTAIADEDVTLYKGKYNFLKYGNVAANPAPTFTFATGTPAAGIDYIFDPKAGSIYVPSNSAIADETDVTVDYTYAPIETVGAFASNSRYHILRFLGLNQADSYKPVIVEIFRAKLMPTSSLPLINNEVAQFEVQAQLLLDPLRQYDSVEGAFFSIKRAL